MKSIIEVISLAFTIGLTGALALGPTLVATIESSLKGGWSAGPKVAAGHALVELAIFLLIIVGLAEATQQFSHYIAWIGGLALIAFGILTIRDCRKATFVDSQKNGRVNLI
ncbi:MAG: LysE family translocator [Methanotrichaceae archaeon]|nr:LysE family translocator [Methanotrichaceae archaeon]